MDYIEMNNEEFIEECIEENEATEGTEIEVDGKDNPLQRAPAKKKRERTEKQIESLKKAQAARARNIAEKKLKKSVPTIKETLTTNNITTNPPRAIQSRPSPVVAPASHMSNKKKKRRQRIIIQNDDSSSSEEDVIVIQNKHKKKKKKLKKPIVVESSSDSEEDDNDHSNFAQENIKNNYQTSFRFI